MKKFLEFGTPERTAYTKKVTPGEIPNGKFQKADHIKKKDFDERVMSTPQKVTQMQHYWDDLDHMASDDMKKKKMQMKFGIKNIKLDQKGKILSFESVDEDRDYKDEYKKFQSSEKMRKYRAELNKYNREKGTYGNHDGKDASHKDGKIVGMEDQSTNRGRAEKSRLVGSKRK